MTGVRRDNSATQSPTPIINHQGPKTIDFTSTPKWRVSLLIPSVLGTKVLDRKRMLFTHAVSGGSTNSYRVRLTQWPVTSLSLTSTASSTVAGLTLSGMYPCVLMNPLCSSPGKQKSSPYKRPSPLVHTSSG